MISLLKDLWLFIKENKRWGLIPLLLVLFGFGSLIMLAQGSAIAPFIYTIF